MEALCPTPPGLAEAPQRPIAWPDTVFESLDSDLAQHLRARSHLMLLVPTYAPAPGGCSVYARLLAEGLAARGTRVFVFSEAFAGEAPLARGADGRLEVMRALPCRAGASQKGIASYAAYARQQAQLLDLPRLAKARGITHALIHSSFYYNPGVIRRVVDRLAAQGVRLMLDVRDPKLDIARLGANPPFDWLVCCSKRVAAQLAGTPLGARVRHIPMLFEPDVGPIDRRSLLARHGLAERGYLFSANGLFREKSSDVLVMAARLLARQGRALPLVIAGRRRDHAPLYAKAAKAGVLRFIGPQTHRDTLALMAGAAAVINPSAVESPSRMSIEALMLGVPSLLPPDVPEFAHDGALIADANDPETLAGQIDDLIRRRPRPAYDVSEHLPGKVLPRYEALLAT